MCYARARASKQHHVEYDATAANWIRARDIIAGEDEVKAGGSVTCRHWVARRRRSMRLIGIGRYGSPSPRDDRTRRQFQFRAGFFIQ
jgi:hypothetical protein